MRKTFIFLCFLIIIMTLNAYTCNDFLVGSFGALNNRIGFQANYFSPFLGYTADAHYNTAYAEYLKDWDEPGSEVAANFNDCVLDPIANKQMAAVFMDYQWDNNWMINHNVSLYGLTNSNYLRLEAEYKDSTSVNTNDSSKDQFFYCFDREAPNPVGDTYYQYDDAVSNQYFYSYDPSSYPYPNYSRTSPNVEILGQMHYRWPWTGYDPNDRLFQFPLIYTSEDANYLLYDSLYISVALKWTANSANNTSLIKIKFTNNSVEIDTTLFLPRGNPLNNYGLTLLDSDLNKGATYPDHPNNGFRVFTYSISLKDLHELVMLVDGGGSFRELHGFGVQVLWNPQKSVAIDYLEFEDTVHRKMRTDHDNVKDWLQDYLERDDLSSDNIILYNSVDEPRIGNFDSFGLVKGWLCDMNKPPLMTPNNDNRFPDNLHKPDGSLASLLRIFDALAKPEVILANDYPIHPDLNWNNPSASTFIQTA